MKVINFHTIKLQVSMAVRIFRGIMSIKLPALRRQATALIVSAESQYSYPSSNLLTLDQHPFSFQHGTDSTWLSTRQVYPIHHISFTDSFKQLLASHVQAVAQTYHSTPLAETYEAAANNFRIPYWDWAVIPSMPAVVSQQYVQITTASGVQTVQNPLFQ